MIQFIYVFKKIFLNFFHKHKTVKIKYLNFKNNYFFQKNWVSAGIGSEWPIYIGNRYRREKKISDIGKLPDTQYRSHH